MKTVLFILAIVALWLVVQQVLNGNKAKQNIELGEAFLQKNAMEDGVATTASGLQYKVLNVGTGSTHPNAIVIVGNKI